MERKGKEGWMDGLWTRLNKVEGEAEKKRTIRVIHPPF